MKPVIYKINGKTVSVLASVCDETVQGQSDQLCAYSFFTALCTPDHSDIIQASLTKFLSTVP